MIKDTELNKGDDVEEYDDDVVEHNFKVLVIGDIDVGKTCLIKRYVHNVFSENSKSTIGVDFALKVLKWDRKNRINIQLWDIAGQERFNHMTRVYYKEAIGAFVVFDVTRGESFDAVGRWKADLDSKTGLPMPDGYEKPLPAILIANKSDLLMNIAADNPKPPKWGAGVPKEGLDEYCQSNAFIAWFESSSKDTALAENIDKAMRTLVEDIMEYNDKYGAMEMRPTASHLNLPKQEKTDSCC